MKFLISISASKTKSFKGTTECIATTSIRLEDDDHESVIKKGEHFLLKKLGSRHYAMDKEGKDYYQFSIDEKKYNALLKKHGKAKADTKDSKKPSAKKSGKLDPKAQEVLDKYSAYKKLLANPKVKQYLASKSLQQRGRTHQDDIPDAQRASEVAEYEKDPEVKKYLKAENVSLMTVGKAVGGKLEKAVMRLYKVKGEQAKDNARIAVNKLITEIL